MKNYSLSSILSPEELKILSDVIKMSQNVLVVFRQGEVIYHVSGVLDNIFIGSSMNRLQRLDFFRYTVYDYDADVVVPVNDGEFQFFFQSPDKIVTDTMIELTTELENMLYD